MILLNCLAFAIQLAIPPSFETVLVDPVKFGIDVEADSDDELIPVRIEVPGFIDYILSHGDGFHPIQPRWPKPKPILNANGRRTCNHCTCI